MLSGIVEPFYLLGNVIQKIKLAFKKRFYLPTVTILLCSFTKTQR